MTMLLLSFLLHRICPKVTVTELFLIAVPFIIRVAMLLDTRVVDEKNKNMKWFETIDTFVRSHSQHIPLMYSKLYTGVEIEPDQKDNIFVLNRLKTLLTHCISDISQSNNGNYKTLTIVTRNSVLNMYLDNMEIKSLLSPTVYNVV